jgi:DNA (cytosine-5)-methyltransferase 1
LREQVDKKTMDIYKQTSSILWPTPTTQEIEHPQAELTPNNRRLSKNGNSSHSLNLADSVIMWPTPTTKGYGHASMGQTMIFRKKVEAGEMTEQQAEQMLGVTLRPPRMEKWDYPKKEMFPTPTARDYKDSGSMENWKENRQRMSLPRKVYKGVMEQTSEENQSLGSLNPTWVEWLMGYPTGYTDLDV